MENALLKQRTLRPAIGELAMERSWISRKGIFKILITQKDPSLDGKKFGEGAVELDLLNKSQVDELVLMQSHPSNFIGEILVGQKVLSVPDLIRALSEFNKLLKKQG